MRNRNPAISMRDYLVRGGARTEQIMMEWARGATVAQLAGTYAQTERRMRQQLARMLRAMADDVARGIVPRKRVADYGGECLGGSRLL